MPRPTPLILWFEDRNTDQPHQAIVTEIGDNTIKCSVIVNGALAFLPRDNVRFRRSIVEIGEDVGDGFWDFQSDTLVAPQLTDEVE